MAMDETIGWEFLYILSDKIDCDRDIHDMNDVKFVTDDDQNVITKFKITVRIQDQSNARLKADQMAGRLTLLLVASSGTYSMHSLKGWDEIKASGKRKVGSVTASAFQLRNHAIMNIEPARFRDILNGNDELAEKIHYIASAWQASKAYDYASVIKHLHMACNEDPDTAYNKYVATIKDDHDTACKDNHNDQSEKFKGLRDALSHSKGPLKKNTRERLKGFGDGYFTLTDAGKFDFSSTSNLRNLKIQAGKLLVCVHAALKKDLAQRKEPFSDD